MPLFLQLTNRYLPPHPIWPPTHPPIYIRVTHLPSFTSSMNASPACFCREFCHSWEQSSITNSTTEVLCFKVTRPEDKVEDRSSKIQQTLIKNSSVNPNWSIKGDLWTAICHVSFSQVVYNHQFYQSFHQSEGKTQSLASYQQLLSVRPEKRL